MQHHHQPTTIAILGADTVVGRALCVLLEGSVTRPSYSIPTPQGLSTSCLRVRTCAPHPQVDEGVREAFLGAMGKSAPQRADMPVIVLHTALEEDLPEKEGVISVPWPCETKVLVDTIEAALLDVPAASSCTLLPKPGRAERALGALMRLFVVLETRCG